MIAGRKRVIWFQTAPILLSERVINGHITLEKNPYYWDAGKVRLSKVSYRIVSDNDATTDQYLSGNIDFTDRFNMSEKERLQRILGSQVVISPIFATVILGLQPHEASI